jgi:dihydropteroate synthase
MDELVAVGYPVLMGTSRKSFLGRLAPSPDGTPAPVDHRLPGSLATATWAMTRGAAMVRVHDVKASVQAATLVGPTPAAAAGVATSRSYDPKPSPW